MAYDVLRATALFGPAAIAQASAIIHGSTEYGPITTGYGCSDIQVIQQSGGVPVVPTLPTTGSGLFFLDTLVVELLADTLVNSGNNPLAWVPTITASIEAFYGNGWCAAHPGATYVYDQYIQPIFSFWPTAVRDRMLASFTNYAKINLAQGNLGQLVDGNGIFQFAMLLTPNRNQALETEAGRYRMKMQTIHTVQPNLTLLSGVDAFGGAVWQQFPHLGADQGFRLETIQRAR